MEIAEIPDVEHALELIGEQAIKHGFLLGIFRVFELGFQIQDGGIYLRRRKCASCSVGRKFAEPQ